MRQIKTATSKRRIKELMKVIKDNGLMFKMGGISTLFTKIDKIACVGVLYENGTAISCALTTKGCDMFGLYNIAAYTKIDHRNRGHSKVIIEKVLKREMSVNKLTSRKLFSDKPHFYQTVISSINIKNIEVS